MTFESFSTAVPENESTEEQKYEVQKERQHVQSIDSKSTAPKVEQESGLDEYQQFVVNEFTKKCPDLLDELLDEVSRNPDSAWDALESLIDNHRPPRPRWSDKREDPAIYWEKKAAAARAMDKLREWVRRAPEGPFRNRQSQDELWSLLNAASAVHR